MKQYMEKKFMMQYKYLQKNQCNLAYAYFLKKIPYLQISFGKKKKTNKTFQI